MAISSITKTTENYTVCKGDTFSEIVQRCIQVSMPGYSGLNVYYAGINKLKSFNPDIEDVDLIYVGQKIILQGTAATKTTNKTLKKAKITNFGLQSSRTDSTLFATWAWDADHTDHYEVRWKYATGVGVKFIGSQTTVTVKQSVYTENNEDATLVTFEVKPIAKNHKVNGKDTPYWKAGWSTVKTYYFKNGPPDKPGSPTVEIKDSKLTAKLNYTDSKNRATSIRFEIVKNNKTVFDTGEAKLKTNYASYSCKIDPGSEYKVRCRAISSKSYSEWSEYSSNLQSAPAASKGIKIIYVLSSTSLGISWYSVKNATGYEIQYAVSKRYFDSNPTEVSSKTIDSTVSHAEITGLTSGYEYFFRVRATNEKGNSPWTEVKSVKIGEVPSAPTTWSSTTTVISGEPLTLYWVHNSADNSRQTEAVLELDVGGNVTTHKTVYGTCISITNVADSEVSNKIVSLPGFVLAKGAIIKVLMTFSNTSSKLTLNVNNTGAKTVTKVSTLDSFYWPAGALVTFVYDGTNWQMTEYKDEDESDTNSYSVDTSGCTEGTKIKWRVKTAGIFTDSGGNRVYSDWSIQRTIDVYAPPTLALTATDSMGTPLGTETELDDSGVITVTQLESFPFIVTAEAGPNTQKPIGYYISVTSTEVYETVDEIGNIKTVNNGEEVYYKYFDVVSNPLKVNLSASDIDLENNITYKITCTVAMNSGLTAEKSLILTVGWADDIFYTNAEITYDNESCTAFIGPYCDDDNGKLAEGVALSVYRREFDGSFTEIASGLENTDHTYVTDPHPSLDYARYRIVATKASTGTINYYDVPGVAVGEKAAIIQWDEDWKNFDVVSENPMDQPMWSGSMLKLMYNIDVSDNHTPDVELIEYIGRKHPVSYYGTQVGHSSNWSMSIPKSDAETLYMLRRLAAWMGDVYVREPSGSGYWANVAVSFSQTHCEIVIPVTLKITRVEGGK